MANQAQGQPPTLAESISERLEQLGMSRRELSRRTRLSRQTIHNIERCGTTNLKPSTFQALDEALHWEAGTALALAMGKVEARSTEEKVLDYVARIAVHMARMTSEELELTLIMMEENELGSGNHSTDEMLSKIRKLAEGWQHDLLILREVNHKHAS